MSLLKRLFGKDKNQNENWTMFSTSKKEVEKLLVNLGQLTIGKDFLKIENYPFEPSVAYKKTIFNADEIENIDFKSYPPTFQINNELIFARTEQQTKLEIFAKKNNIQTVERAILWDWILEPFLDTEFTDETNIRLTELLNSYGLSKEKVNSIRAEVETQMLKYNFDTMLWEWVTLGADDVLRAMRTKYNKEQFQEFYKEVMEIAMIAKKTIE